MRRILAYFRLMSLLPFAATQQGPRRDEEAYVLALESGWTQAEAQYDSKALEPLLADNFVITEPDGTQNNKELHLARVAGADRSHRPESFTVADFKVHFYGSSAVVTGTYRGKGSYKERSSTGAADLRTCGLVSADDPYIKPDRAAELANCWGSRWSALAPQAISTWRRFWARGQKEERF